MGFNTISGTANLAGLFSTVPSKEYETTEKLEERTVKVGLKAQKLISCLSDLRKYFSSQIFDKNFGLKVEGNSSCFYHNHLSPKEVLALINQESPSITSLKLVRKSIHSCHTLTGKIRSRIKESIKSDDTFTSEKYIKTGSESSFYNLGSVAKKIDKLLETVLDEKIEQLKNKKLSYELETLSHSDAVSSYSSDYEVDGLYISY